MIKKKLLKVQSIKTWSKTLLFDYEYKINGQQKKCRACKEIYLRINWPTLDDSKSWYL